MLLTEVPRPVSFCRPPASPTDVVLQPCNAKATRRMEAAHSAIPRRRWPSMPFTRAIVDCPAATRRRCVDGNQSAGWRGTGESLVSDRSCELVERGRYDEPGAGVNAELVVTSAKVLHERVAADDCARRAIGLQPAYRSKPGLEPSMVRLEAVVCVLGGVVVGGGH